MKTDNDTTPRRCARCGETKTRGDFAPDYTRADSLDSYCRACRRQMERGRRGGGTTRLLAKFTDQELLAELTRRNLIAEKLDELGELVAPEYAEE